MPQGPRTVFDAVMTRKSIRSFADAPVEGEKLARCLDAARWAPSWRNSQCWHFIVIRGRDEVERLSLLPPYIKNAPALLVACGDPAASGSLNGKPYYLVDVAIAVEHIVLAAWEQGLGTCWLGEYDEEKIRLLLGVPPHVKVVALLPIGYPSVEEGEDIRRIKEEVGSERRKRLTEFVHDGRW